MSSEENPTVTRALPAIGILITTALIVAGALVLVWANVWNALLILFLAALCGFATRIAFSGRRKGLPKEHHLFALSVFAFVFVCGGAAAAFGVVAVFIESVDMPYVLDLHRLWLALGGCGLALAGVIAFTWRIVQVARSKTLEGGNLTHGIKYAAKPHAEAEPPRAAETQTPPPEEAESDEG